MLGRVYFYSMLVVIGTRPQMTTAEKAWKEDQVQFLFENQILCGNPFADAQWIPALDMCTMECNPMTELCVEDDELKQKCNKLPDACVNLLQGKQNEKTSLSGGADPLDTGAFGLVLMQKLHRGSGRSG